MRQAEWEGESRAESRSWPDERIVDAIRVIGRSGVSLDDTAHPAIVHAFLGPTDPEEIARLPALGAAEDAATGSGRYGDRWRLPLSHEARASAGVRLALLGDTRRGVGLRADGLQDIDWVSIEGGEVTLLIRSNPEDTNSDIINTLTRVVASFRIARYPVTIAQFQAFLADCHRDGTWRLPPGFPVEFPADYPPPKHRARYSNYPADSVNWLDAAAFCHWLSARFGFDIRLPTEYEWQHAATGGDSARIYPWGSDWDPQKEPWRANTAESGLNRSTAVGFYPLGASQAGILDMAGTVYEWCGNAFDDPDSTVFAGCKEIRPVRRGGSWDDIQDFARCADRGRRDPPYRLDGFGFRVVSSSASLIRGGSICVPGS
jgi:formylglycine-generating enzyme required for sulfatase activity